MRKYIILAICVVLATSLSAQVLTEMGRGSGTESREGQQPKTTIIPNVKAWRYIDDFTLADTLKVDTLLTSFQVFNPIWRKSISNITTGNLGAAYISNIIDDRKSRSEFLFYNSLIDYYDYPQDVLYYNTRTPYVNLSYHSGQPKRRSEEHVQALFTQNVNKKLNVGMKYSLISALGRYDGQKVKNADFRLFASYDGDKYKSSGGLISTKGTMAENGGIVDDNYILNPGDAKDDYKDPENVPINFRDATNYLRSFKLFYNQSYNLGNITRTDKEGEEQELPVTTIYHSAMVDLAKRVYSIDELPDYKTSPADNFYPNIYIDSLTTRDLTEYTLIRNQFQIKFNEEANSLLRFGMRAFIGNDIRLYSMPAAPYYDIEDNLHYRYNDSTLVTSYIGGQIFKNIGSSFKWNAGMRFYFQGYRVGDFEVTGKMSSEFTLLNQKSEVFADGLLSLRSPELLEEHYFSNHIKWDESFIREKMVRVRGGVRLPKQRLYASASVRSINGYIYFNREGLPTQNSDLIQVIAVEGGKHFEILGINSINRAAWQYSSNGNALPLPQISLYSSNFYQNTLFKVLTFQLGFDVRYHSKFYTPYYLPATGQFIAQNVREVGDYPFVDLFLNLHLKRARIYVKYDHVNKGWPDDNYFHTIGYPANPRSLKFGVSWNFYD